MWLVISVNDGRVSQVKKFKAKSKAFNDAVAQAVEQGSEEGESVIRKELADGGDYIPNKYPEWSVAVHEVGNSVVLANLPNGIGAAVILNGETIYHEDDDKGYSQEFSAESVANRTAKALGVKVKTVALKWGEIDGGAEEWNFDGVNAAVNKRTGVVGPEEEKAERARLSALLREKEREFKAAGGRGVELADEIDDLRRQLGK